MFKFALVILGVIIAAALLGYAYGAEQRIRQLEYEACGIRQVFEDGSIIPETDDAVRFKCMDERR